MRAGPFRWVVLFFSRPVSLSDGAAIRRLFRRRRPIKAETEGENDVSATKPSRLHSGEDVSDDHWSDRRPSAAVDVSEQPLDTLPAELQEALRLKSPPTS